MTTEHHYWKEKRTIASMLYFALHIAWSISWAFLSAMIYPSQASYEDHPGNYGREVIVVTAYMLGLYTLWLLFTLLRARFDKKARTVTLARWNIAGIIALLTIMALFVWTALS